MRSGEYLVNGMPPDESFSLTVGFVAKDDVHLPTMTVRETLMFSANLRIRKRIPPLLRALRVEVVLKLLGYVATLAAGRFR